MSPVILLSLLLLICVVIAGILLEDKSPIGVLFGFLGMIAFIALVGFVSPQELGWGHVPDKAEVFTKRLEAGVAYQLLASSKESGDQVLLVKETGTSNFYAIRVKEAPPEHFTLVGGKPVAIAAPAPPVGVK